MNVFEFTFLSTDHKLVKVCTMYSCEGGTPMVVRPGTVILLAV